MSSDESSDSEMSDQLDSLELTLDAMRLDSEYYKGKLGKKRHRHSTINHWDPDLANLQKVNECLVHLPHFDQIKAYGFSELDDIKRNLSESVILNEIRPGFFHWTKRLGNFIEEFSLFFTKVDHIKFIKLCISVVETPDIDLITAVQCFSTLSKLLKHTRKLTREDLVIKWRPIYNLYQRISNFHQYSTEYVPKNAIGSLLVYLEYARLYFEASSTREMLEEFRPKLHPIFRISTTTLNSCSYFLPILNCKETCQCHGLWLSEFLYQWSSFGPFYAWNKPMVRLFTRIAKHIVGTFNWDPYIPYIFTTLLRGFGLPFCSKELIKLGSSEGAANTSVNVSQAVLFSTQEIANYAHWIVYIIGTGPNRGLCMDHIRQLFLTVRSFYHPSNYGSWSANLFLFLEYFAKSMVNRVTWERISKKSSHDAEIPHENTISDKDVAEFVNILKDIVFTAIFSKSYPNNALRAFQSLTHLRGDLMLPPLIEMLFESVNNSIEPHRYWTVLTCTTMVPREIFKYENTQLSAIPLMFAVLPGLDVQEVANRCSTLRFLSKMFDSVIICDCLPAVKYRYDLSERELELCFETSKFEDFVHEFFNK